LAFFKIDKKAAAAQTWAVIIAFTLGILVIFFVISMAVSSSEFGSILNLFGLKLFESKSDTLKVDTALKEIGDAFSECQSFKGDNCVCDGNIILDLNNKITVDVYGLGDDTILDIGGNTVSIPGKFCYLDFNPIDLADWSFSTTSEIGYDYMKTEPIKLNRNEDSIFVTNQDNVFIKMPVPYRLIKWQNKICFSTIESAVSGRKCSQLSECRGTYCNSTSFCIGMQDPFYKPESTDPSIAKCCSEGCSKTPETREKWQMLLDLADKAFDSRRYRDAADLYLKLYSRKEAYDKFVYSAYRLGQSYFLLEDINSANYVWRNYLVSLQALGFPDAAKYVKMADNMTDDKMSCDEFNDTWFEETDSEKDKCNNDRTSLMNGCYYYYSGFSADLCKDCTSTTPCSAITGEYTCKQSPCRNIGETICRWEANWLDPGKCVEGTRNKQCSDLKNKRTCTETPCLETDRNRCCTWDTGKQRCVAIKS
jgi:hypothetical protein